MSTGGYLLAPGIVTVREGEKPRRDVPMAEHWGYDRLAASLGEALGIPIRVVDEPGPELRDAFPQLLPGILGDMALDPGRAMIVDANPSDVAATMRQSLLGAVTDVALRHWRRGEPPGPRPLYGLESAAARMGDAVQVSPHIRGYAYLSTDEPDLIAFIAAYLRAADPDVS